MTEFCRNFCFQCEKCKKAKEEVEREEKILAEIVGPIHHRTDLEKAALDCHGQP